MPTVEAPGAQLHYSSRGEGPAVVLVHGMAADAAGWGPVADALAGEARVVTYDRRGYGASGAPQPYERTTVNEQAEDLASILDALDAGPAVAAGVDFGALVVLDVLLRHPGLLRGAVLVDPPLYALAPEATEALAAERLALEEALREGGPERAVELYVGSRAGGAERLARARASARAFFADYGGLATLPVARRELRAIAVPVAVVDARDAPAHQRAASAELARLLPGARRAGDVVGAARELLA